MPIKKAAEKALRQNKKQRERNLKFKNEIKKMLVEFRKTSAKNDKGKAEETAKKLIKALDKASANGYLKKNTVNRKKSRLMKKLNALKKA